MTNHMTNTAELQKLAHRIEAQIHESRELLGRVQSMVHQNMRIMIHRGEQADQSPGSLWARWSQVGQVTDMLDDRLQTAQDVATGGLSPAAMRLPGEDTNAS